VKCNHCRSAEGVNRWEPALCADGRRKRRKWLCDACDELLNRMVLEFFNDPKVEEKMARYAQPTSGS